MNKTNKNKKYFLFLVPIIFLISFLLFPCDAKADSTILVYSLMTPDPTPLIKGTVSDSEAHVFVVVEGYAAQEATISDDGSSWSLQFNDTLATETTYSVGVAAAVDGEIISAPAFIYVNEEYPVEFYFEVNFEIEGELSVLSFGFTDEYAYASDDGNFSFTFPAGIVITKTGSGNFNLENWQDNGVDLDNARLISQLRFGVSDIGLDFSKEVTVTFILGEGYNGQTLNIFTKGEGSDTDGWEPMDVSCVVTGGRCSFSTSHASYFGISEYASLFEDDDEDNQKAHVDSWKAYRYEDANKSCSSRLKLIIKVKDFDKDAKVEIGNHEASSVNKKSSKEIVAKFCMDKLLNNQANHKKTISITNPNTDAEEADKKIDLDNIGYNMLAENFNSQTVEGIKNIQTALVNLGFLDQQYITSFYGQLTTNAVQKFQADNGIPQTGYVGSLTKAKLEEKIK